MTQADFFSSPAARPFKDIRNQRDSVAERKARLLLELGELMRKPPEHVINGSVNATRAWLEKRERAAKVAKSSRSSVPELEYALRDMEQASKGEA